MKEDNVTGKDLGTSNGNPDPAQLCHSLVQQNSIEHLLKPRYKVIADYPNSPFSIGEILLVNESQVLCGMIPNYPHLFRKLEWWEERDTSELPLYVRFGSKDSQHAYYKVIGWNDLKGDCDDLKPWGFAETPSEYFISLRFPNNFPATEAEYTEYLNQK